MDRLLSFLLLIVTLNFSCQQADDSKAILVEKASMVKLEIPTNRSPLYQSLDDGKSWQPIGQDLPTGTQASFIKKINNQLVLATDNEGLFLSDESKQKWQFISGQLPNQKITALYVVATEIYVSVYQKGLYFSSDMGKNWISLNANLPELRIGAIYKKKDKLFAGTDIGLYELKKGETTWKLITEKVQITAIQEVKGKIVAGTSQGILLVNNNKEGWNWIQQKGALHNLLVIDETIVALYIHGDLFLSKDMGKSWIEGNYSPRKQSYIYTAVNLKDDSYILTNNYGIHQSLDGGVNWSLIYPEEEKIFMDFLVDDTIIYGGTRGWNEYRQKSNAESLLNFSN